MAQIPAVLGCTGEAFEYYLLLVTATLSLLVVVWLIWLRTKCVGFVVGLGLLYYWTLYGAWELVGDLSHGGGQHRYQYLFAKMFNVTLDGDYFKSLVYYSIFLLVTGCTVLVVSGRTTAIVSKSSPLELRHSRLLLASFVALIVSYLLVRENLVEAIAFNYSGYEITAAGQGAAPMFSLHQAFNLFAVIPIAIGVPLLATGMSGRFLVGHKNFTISVCYGLLASALFLFGMVMGNKGEVFFALIAAVVLYTLNAGRVRWFRTFVMGIAALAAVSTIDYARTLALGELTAGLSSKRSFEAIGDIAHSNEAFAAHFSMYGVLHHHVPLTYGSSVASLLMSAVPRIFWSNRPDTVYAHYASSLGLVEGQGYTVHHATGWYLNFGLIGLVVGAIVLGGLWAVMQRNLAVNLRHYNAQWVAALAVAFALFTGGLPRLVRVGMEGYKTVVIFQLIVPYLLIRFASVRGNKI